MGPGDLPGARTVPKNKNYKFHKNIWGPGDLPGARPVPKKNTKNSPKIFGALGTSQVPVRSRKKLLKIPQKYLGPWGPPRCPYGPEKKYSKYLGPWGPPRCPY